MNANVTDKNVLDRDIVKICYIYKGSSKDRIEM